MYNGLQSKRNVGLATFAAVVAMGSIGGANAFATGPSTGQPSLSDSSWFEPIARYYDYNPLITPGFDFASLYGAP